MPVILSIESARGDGVNHGRVDLQENITQGET
jgi:hypothetical protein